jgi:hypothetical protein
MRRTLVLGSLAALVLAGCGGAGSTAPAPPPEPDPAATLRALIAAPPVPTQLLARASRARVRGSELSAGVGSFPDDAPVRSRGAGPGWAVAWTSGDRVGEGRREFAAYGVALRRSGSRWLAEIGGPVQLRPLGPDPGSAVGTIPQVAVELRAPRAIEDASLWVDGQPVDYKSGGPSTRYVSIYGAPAAPLEPGRHVAVAFARAGTTASAVAWPFTVR